MAFVSVGKPDLRQSARHGNREAERLLKLRTRPERVLSVIQLGITLVGAVSATVGGVSAEERLTPVIQSYFQTSENLSTFIAVLIVVLPLTYLSVVVGELVPKTVALRNPLRISLFGAPGVSMLGYAFSPVVTFLEFSTKGLIKVFLPKSMHKVVDQLSTEESVSLEGLSQSHRQYVLNLVDIESKRIRDIYVQWQNVDLVGVDQSLQEVLGMVIKSGHTRLPVMKDGEVIGLLHTKEFLSFITAGEENWNKIIRQTLKVSDHEELLMTLRRMQSSKSHMGVVYSGSELLGVVTLEDIIEEIVGEIYDEDDDGNIRRMMVQRISKRKTSK
jgi:putative hemolysin